MRHSKARHQALCPVFIEHISCIIRFTIEKCKGVESEWFPDNFSKSGQLSVVASDLANQLPIAIVPATEPVRVMRKVVQSNAENDVKCCNITGSYL